MYIVPDMEMNLENSKPGKQILKKDWHDLFFDTVVPLACIVGSAVALYWGIRSDIALNRAEASAIRKTVDDKTSAINETVAKNADTMKDLQDKQFAMMDRQMAAEREQGKTQLELAKAVERIATQMEEASPSDLFRKVEQLERKIPTADVIEQVIRKFIMDKLTDRWTRSDMKEWVISCNRALKEFMGIQIPEIQ